MHGSHDGSCAAVDRHDDGYSPLLLPTYFDDNGMISTSSLPLPIAPTYYQHVHPRYYEQVTGQGGGGTITSFPLAFSGATGISGPQHHVLTAGSQLFTGIGRSTQHHYELYHSANTKGGGGATFRSPHLDDGLSMHYVPHHVHAPNSGCSRSPLLWSMAQIDSFVVNSL